MYFIRPVSPYSDEAWHWQTSPTLTLHQLSPHGCALRVKTNIRAIPQHFLIPGIKKSHYGNTWRDSGAFCKVGKWASDRCTSMTFPQVKLSKSDTNVRSGEGILVMSLSFRQTSVTHVRSHKITLISLTPTWNNLRFMSKSRYDIR